DSKLALIGEKVSHAAAAHARTRRESRLGCRGPEWPDYTQIFSPGALLKPDCVMTCISRRVNQTLRLMPTWALPSGSGFVQRTIPCTSLTNFRTSLRSRTLTRSPE